MELRMSSVCDDCRSAGGAWPFFFAALPLRLLVVLTSTGLSYLTRELWGGIIVGFFVVMPTMLYLLRYVRPERRDAPTSDPKNISPTFHHHSSEICCRRFRSGDSDRLDDSEERKGKFASMYALLGGWI